MRGVQGVTIREITEAAGQRNVSAVSYHFHSRQGLLAEVLARRGAPVDRARGEARDALGPRPAPGDLVACLITPYTALLHAPAGRSYLRIVAQLRGRFALWRDASDPATTTHLTHILAEVEALPRAPGPVRRERVVSLIMLLTASVAERARRIDDGTGTELDHEAFTANLISMCTALLSP